MKNKTGETPIPSGKLVPNGKADVLKTDEGNLIDFPKGLTREELEVLLDEIWNAGYLERENYADSVIRRRVAEETHWEDREDWKAMESEESIVMESAAKTVERKKADMEAFEQNESINMNNQ